MINNDQQEINRIAAHMFSPFHLFYNLFTEEVFRYLAGGDHLRYGYGVAKTAIYNIDSDEYAEQCRNYLLVLMNDPNKDVRSQVNRMFRKELFVLKENLAFIQAYIKSKAFQDEPFRLFHCLEDIPIH
jgi:hypothetical protein